MGPLEIAWSIALIVLLGALPIGLIRMVAYRTGGWDSRTMGISAWFAVGLGLAGLVAFVVLSYVLLLT